MVSKRKKCVFLVSTGKCVFSGSAGKCVFPGPDVPRFVDQSIAANQRENQDVLSNLTEVRSSDRIRHTDRAVPRAS